MEKKKHTQTPLTKEVLLETLVDYNRDIFAPELKEIFVGKKEFTIFKDEALTSLDRLHKKLDTLLAEKTVKEYQEVKEKRLWAIVLKSLKDHSILTNRELEAIAKLELF